MIILDIVMGRATILQMSQIEPKDWLQAIHSMAQNSSWPKLVSSAPAPFPKGTGEEYHPGDDDGGSSH